MKCIFVFPRLWNSKLSTVTCSTVFRSKPSPGTYTTYLVRHKQGYLSLSRYLLMISGWVRWLVHSSTGLLLWPTVWSHACSTFLWNSPHTVRKSAWETPRPSDFIQSVTSRDWFQQGKNTYRVYSDACKTAKWGRILSSKNGLRSYLSKVVAWMCCLDTDKQTHLWNFKFSCEYNT